jgi:hypothetical protein
LAKSTSCIPLALTYVCFRWQEDYTEIANDEERPWIIDGLTLLIAELEKGEKMINGANVQAGVIRAREIVQCQTVIEDAEALLERIDERPLSIENYAEYASEYEPLKQQENNLMYEALRALIREKQGQLADLVATPTTKYRGVIE